MFAFVSLSVFPSFPLRIVFTSANLEASLNKSGIFLMASANAAQVIIFFLLRMNFLVYYIHHFVQRE